MFKWTAEEFATYSATEAILPNAVNHYLPGQTVAFRCTHSVQPAAGVEDAVRVARAVQSGIAGTALE